MMMMMRMRMMRMIVVRLGKIPTYLHQMATQRVWQYSMKRTYNEYFSEALAIVEPHSVDGRNYGGY